MTTTEPTDQGAAIIAQAWLEQIQLVREMGDMPGVLYVSQGDWNRVAAAVGLAQLDDRRLPQVAQFMDNPVMVVPDLKDGISYLGKRIMP